MTHAVVEGKYVLRMAIAATLTEERHVLGAWKVILKRWRMGSSVKINSAPSVS
ncbi:Tyrosine/DOPA decarboxylase 1 [Acorus calamus]|uniref:Tyrosine/DOPA decarboxylase 1 n=1 Tax=Acorus calamus TaxID=4465 RepID=A0AAV9DXY1_ACOCL|nr:Tyrosine/DOPA decarboxylase 1 [Acorus calamus]